MSDGLYQGFDIRVDDLSMMVLTDAAELYNVSLEGVLNWERAAVARL